MLKTRIIPTLLLQENQLIKTKQFEFDKYIGDPINAVRIFNEKECDELIILDIDATKKGLEPNYKLISIIANQCRMPLTYGGGIKTVEQALKIISLGVEKISISSELIKSINLIKDLSCLVGNQSVVATFDVKKEKGLFGNKYKIFTHNGKVSTNLDLLEYALTIEEKGIGEIVINLINNDGMMNGYDIDLAKKLIDNLSIPITFIGGAGSLDDISKLIEETNGRVAAGAGSLFVFKGKYKAVLINYPGFEEKEKLFKNIRKN